MAGIFEGAVRNFAIFKIGGCGFTGCPARSDIRTPNPNTKSFRHNELLTELAISRTLLLVTSGYSEHPQPQDQVRSQETSMVHPEASYWTSACLNDEPDFESWIHLYASQLMWSAGCLDQLLRLVADYAIANVLCCWPMQICGGCTTPTTAA